MARTKKNPQHYVDNKKLLEEMKKFKKDCKDADAVGDNMPPVPDYVGECFLKIANGLSFRPNFINYTYRDEMISDGIENCLQYVYNFDPNKSKNPFAYFTQIIYFAFVRRIQKEKKQQATKYKILENIDLNQLLVHSDGNEEYVSQVIDLMKRQMDTIEPDRKEVKK